MSNFNELIEELEKIKKIFTKNPNREFSSTYILNKSTLLEENYESFQQQYKKPTQKLEKHILEKYREKYSVIYKDLKTILRTYSDKFLNTTTHQEEYSSEGELFQDTKNTHEIMASLDIASTMKLLPEFNGELGKVTNFFKLD